jgi:hypothetical protein
MFWTRRCERWVEEVEMATESPRWVELLTRLVGAWTTEASHPAMPGVVVSGRVTVEWLEGARFLIHRGTFEHPQFPDSISIIGVTDRDRDEGTGEASESGRPDLSMHYFDSRGVFRLYSASIEEGVWRIWRNAPGFSQRFTGTFDNDDTLEGLWQCSADDATWEDDLRINYRRRP